MVLAAAAPVLVGMIGLGMEVGGWHYAHAQAQTAADAAALDGAMELRDGRPNMVVSRALSSAARNGFSQSDDTRITTRIVQEIGRLDMVEVTVEHEQDLTFASLFLSGPIKVQARAVAMASYDGVACILALDPAAGGAVQMLGTGTLSAEGCAIASNSTHQSGVEVGGSSTVIADTIWSSGGYRRYGSSSVKVQRAPKTYVASLPDPYGDLTVPAGLTCGKTVPKDSKGQMRLEPGVYCGGMSFGGQDDVLLAPGTYYIVDGNFEVKSSNVKIRCDCVRPTDGVSIVLTGAPAKVGIVAVEGGDVMLRPPSAPDQPYSGVLFFQDRRSTSQAASKINGNSSLQLAGALYFPRGMVHINGSSSISDLNCVQVVAKQVVMNGGGSVKLSHKDCGKTGTEVALLPGIRLHD